jgi:DAK2 domain fusion protein YloV
MLDAPALVRAMALYAQAVEDFRDELDSLNVFPVPDGDTGTNLLHTQRAVAAALSAAELGNAPPDLPVVAGTIAHAALTGARGNSGVILSQVLRAFCAALPSGGADGAATARALHDAAAATRRAVAQPKEGTVLTVLDAAADAADRGRVGDAGDVLAAALGGAREALEGTRRQLPELRAADVVDAGGKGAVLLIDALLAAVTGGEPSEPAGPAGPVGRAAEGGAPPLLTYPYEVEFLLEDLGDGDVVALRSALGEMGDSLAIVGGDALYRVHIHTDRPDDVRGAAARVGTVRDASTTSLKDQVADCLGRAARGVQAGTAALDARPQKTASALIAVLEPSGVADAIRSLGAIVIEPAGDDGPIAGRVDAAIATASAHGVVVLTDASMAEDVRGHVSDDRVDVALVAASSLPAAISGAAEFHPGASPAENAAAMTSAAERLRVGSIPTADGAEAAALVTDMVAGMAAEAPEGEVLTLVAGTGITDDGLAAVTRALAELFPHLRVETLRGPAASPAYQVGLE